MNEYQRRIEKTFRRVHRLMLRDIIKRKGNANRIFTAGGRIDTIKPIDNLDHLVFEQELSSEIDIEKFRQKLKEYQSLKTINNIG